VKPVRVAVLASGNGSNLQALLDAFDQRSPARVMRVISDRPGAGALARAQRAGIATAVLRDPGSAAELRAALADADLVVLAGYLRLIPPAVIAHFPARMVNIHPALLPAFGGPGMYGRRVHEAVLASGMGISGATVHYVDEQYDHGPIIAQWPVPVLPGDDADRLAGRVLEVEHRLLPAVVMKLAELGLPPYAVRLAVDGTAFGARGEPAVALSDGRTSDDSSDGRTVGRSDS
jgi:formyltetrahydrofolate-dependent phosphoribosylglycinamide formyltransferase